MIMRRLRRLVRIVLMVIIAVVVSAGLAAAVGAAVVYLAGPGGALSCVPPTPPPGAQPEPIPRWVIFAGGPALIAALAGAYFALGAERVLVRLVGLVYAAALAAGTFYAVYTYLPAVCRP
jgi:hypothetical protein